MVIYSCVGATTFSFFDTVKVVRVINLATALCSAVAVSDVATTTEGYVPVLLEPHDDPNPSQNSLQCTIRRFGCLQNCDANHV